MIWATDEPHVQQRRLTETTERRTKSWTGATVGKISIQLCNLCRVLPPAGAGAPVVQKHGQAAVRGNQPGRADEYYVSKFPNGLDGQKDPWPENLRSRFHTCAHFYFFTVFFIKFIIKKVKILYYN